MKILMVDKYHFVKGGAERYFFELKHLLERHGHQVASFSMHHPDNLPCEWSPYFVDNIEFNGVSTLAKIKQAPRIIGRILYSTEAKAAIERLIERFKPDIAHLHMIDHQLSPSILHALHKHNIPVLQTCHQYKMVCPSYRLFVARDRRICEKCVTGNFYHAVLERCHKDSLAASALVATEAYLHRLMRIHNIIGLFHVPSRFLGTKLQESGIEQKRIWHQFYTIELQNYPFSKRFDDYLVYYGRLSEEKGVLTLLRAMQQLRKPKLLVIGDGPQRVELEKFVRDQELMNVTFAGNKSGPELVKMVSSAKCVVVPSEWHDNSPLVVYESFSMGRPVVATALGGMPELIEDGVDGRLFAAKDADGLASIINDLLANENRLREMGQAARAKALREFDPEIHYRKIHDVYMRLGN